jgi:LytR cell envelope-related transcriptional attenuator
VKLTGRRYGRMIVAALVLGVLIWLLWHEWSRQRAEATLYGSADARAPKGTRIKVEVLNATRTRGLARRATLYLRDRGFDVVGSGTARSAHPEWAYLVGRAMKARVTAQPDSSRYLDVTVILGADWRPPPQPFYP